MELEGGREGGYKWNWKEEGRGAVYAIGRKKGKGLFIVLEGRRKGGRLFMELEGGMEEG